jgi:hypothetical protein
MVDEIRVVTLTGYLKVSITLDDSAASINLAYTRTGFEITQEGTGFYDIVNLPAGEERITTLKEGLYRVRGFIGKLSSEWVNTEIKNGEVTSRIFHFGRESSK